MTELTPRLALPLLAAGQAQKELFHNEAVALLDALLLAAAAPPQDTPPTSAGDGSAWLVGASPGGDWSGQANAIALRIGGGWRFAVPQAGMTVQLGDGRTARWDGSAWGVGELCADMLLVGGVQVVGLRRPAIADPGGGGTIDAGARAAVAAILAALRNHGLIAT